MMAEGGGPDSGSAADPDPEPVAAQIPTPSTESQKQSIGTLLKTTLRKGDEWFLIDSRWFKQWKKYVGFDSWDMYNVGEHSLYPGPVDNSGLFSDHETQILKEHLIDELDYVLVPTEAWNKLVCWYGCLEGQRPIVRKVVEHGMFVKHCKVEVYLLELNLCENDNMDNVITRHFSKADTIDTIEKEMRSLFEIPTGKETRLWNKYMSNTYEQLNKPDSTVQDAGLFQGQVLVIERKNEDGTWPRQASHPKSSTATSRNFTTSPKLSSNSSATISSTITNGDSSNSGSTLNNSTSSGNRLGGYNSYSSSYNYRESPSQPGLCGLSNLGNTCFMNSALQCLSNASPLTEYFLDDQYEAEINRENPLGMRGEIAESYADLVKQMWLSRSSYVAPRTFKTQVGRFAPQFSGYQQQDSQELLAFLMDGLHEDLNRVKKKPYLALQDAGGRKDEIVAKEAWTNHRLRNDSIIVDIFHGLFKSTLVCPECAKVSVTFDPFCYLTLPLPMKKDRTMEVFLVRIDPQSRPTQYRVVVPKLGSVTDLCSALSRLSGIPAENMVVADVYNHRFHKIYRRDDGLNQIMEKDDIFVYEVAEEDAESMNLPVYFRERHSKHTGGSTGTMLFGQPLLITVPRQNLAADMLYEKVLERIGRYVTRSQSSTGDGRASASASSASCSQAAECSATSSNRNAAASGSGSPLSDGASCSSSNSSNHSGTSNGNGVCEGEEEAMDQQVSPEPENGQSEEDDASDLENGPKTKPCSSTPPKLFSFSMVNSYGTANISPLPCDGNILKLNTHSTVAIDWDSDSKKLCYDDQEAEAYEKHESMLQAPKKKATVALRECIELFTTMETLGEHDPWYCPTCKKHQQATKKFDLWSLPRILVVHLKRFSYNRCWRDKLDTVVDFPVRDLNMSEFVCDPKAGPYVYDLIAVSNHYGGMGGGHYTAYGKNKADGKWHYFDDSSVSAASEDQIVTKAAYVLFYQRRDAGDVPAKPPPSSPLGGATAADDHMDTN
ncbi:ubiquitin carboxyl-terminal hydrolase 4 [Oncorhynchus nerka]|uniref:ubiquitin carboxyl-terminal hydrolase 4 n=1 Tax=Oncorhynchus nerka TaxID=8023 RepID=UPI001130301C|nr:ubiquitin carboxyl-terminal hydrolase 4-like [Oncorhynchus nerka]XP_035633730.2 ubiquitin carboxyl-terminal hydrolase 4-like [Oncorhynchus keta]XP_046167756.1 ubiquitin carboxyl-terminal hydrolase 4-like [Oncorhynchus gorbuscha]